MLQNDFTIYYYFVVILCQNEGTFERFIVTSLLESHLLIFKSYVWD